jgi:hypothetical protein
LRQRRRRAARAWKRAQQLRNDCRKAPNDPDNAELKPVAVSIRDFKIMSGLSNATIFRRIADGWLKSIKIHGRRLISFDEVERLREGAPV